MKKLCIKFDENKKYDIIIDKHAFEQSGQRIKALFPKANKVALICDDVVAGLYAAEVCTSIARQGLACSMISFPHGEASKSHQNLIMIYDRLTQLRFTRADVIVALGGGVTGDMAGFAAGSYLRGIGFVQMPTTLLSMVDSSVGGKVAVNLSGGKNLVGMFYQPKLVLCNPDTLKSLPERVFCDGMAEVIKHSLIQDKELYDHLLDGTYVQNNTQDLIYQNCAIKSRVVLADEYDVGQRMMLNFGHTIGHAIEKYYHYENYTHGEAVAIGMAAITKIGHRLGITPRPCIDAVIDMLKNYHLPYTFDQSVAGALGDIMKNDKKIFGDKLTIVLLKEVGQAILYEINASDFIQLFLEEAGYEQR